MRVTIKLNHLFRQMLLLIWETAEEHLLIQKGLLVGITSAIISPNGAYAGNSFAIPVTIVKKVVE